MQERSKAQEASDMAANAAHNLLVSLAQAVGPLCELNAEFQQNPSREKAEKMLSQLDFRLSCLDKGTSLKEARDELRKAIEKSSV